MRLQLAVAALLAGRAEVIALHEQHLHQRAPLVVQFSASRSPLPCRLRPASCRTSPGGRSAYRAQLAAAVRRELRVIAEVRDVLARGERRLQDRLARLEGISSPSSMNVGSCAHARSPARRSARRHRRDRSSDGREQRAVEVESGLDVERLAGGARTPAGNAARYASMGLQRGTRPRPQWLALCSSRCSLPIALQVVLRALAFGDACP